MRKFSAQAFASERPWGSELLQDFGDVTARLHWTDQPYRWHTNTGPELFVVLDGAVDIDLDFLLQRMHRIDTTELEAQPIGYKWFKQPAKGLGQAWKAESGEDLQKCLVGQQTLQNSGDFCVGVRSDGIKFAHHALLLWSAAVKNEWP